MTGLKLNLLGGLQVTRADIPITSFISNKVPALLAYLAVTRRPHTRDTLAGLLWGEMSDADAKNNLRQALTNLRKFADDCLTITRDSIEFSGDGFIDSAQFESNLRSAASLDPEPASVILTDSLRLYRGDFLEGFHVREAPEFEDWMLAERARLRELALGALHSLTQFHTRKGNFSEAIAFASRLLTFDPWREEAHRHLMLLQARTGQLSAALAQYETCRKLLEKELGVEPSVETTALYERIRSARRSHRHNIPASSTEFIGREAELRKLRQRLADPACRLITLTGLGGAGKTRLAREAARACVDMFINGAWLVSLEAVEADGVIPAIGNVFDFPFTKGDAKKQLLNFLRQKELLLVMDNFEHLLESSALISEILQAASDVKILVTSRQRLDLEGEWLVELSGLESGSLEADQLFIQSARRARAEIQFGEQEQAAVSDICRLVGGLPLGIEIAAAWTRSMNVESIRDEIQKGLDFLASSRRDLPERQRSLRAVFESSWARLNEAEQKTFAALSVFRGGFMREAAEHTAGTITTLVDRSLVQKNNERYELHEVVRQFAGEKLSAKKGIRNAHSAYFAEWVKKCSTMDERQSFPLMTRELENVRAAWAWSAEKADVAEIEKLHGFLARYLDLNGRYFEAQALFQLALDALQAPADAESLLVEVRGILIARLLMSKSRTMGNLGRVDEADAVLISCLRFFRRAEMPADVAVCLNHLGYSAHFTERYEEAKEYYEEELEIARALGNKSEIANALNNLAVTARAMNQIETAISLQVECLALRRELQDHAGISTSLFNLGSALSILHDYEQAKRYLEEAIEITRQLNHTRVLAAALGNLGGILTEEGRHEEALGLYQQGLEIHRESGFRLGIALALDNVGTAYYFLENELEAQYFLRQSIREARELHADYIALDALVSIAGLRARKGDAEKALELLSLVRTHPKVDIESVNAVEKLLPQVVAGSGADAIRAAEERGRMLELEQAINDVLR